MPKVGVFGVPLFSSSGQNIKVYSAWKDLGTKRRATFYGYKSIRVVLEIHGGTETANSSTINWFAGHLKIHEVKC